MPLQTTDLELKLSQGGTEGEVSPMYGLEEECKRPTATCRYSFVSGSSYWQNGSSSTKVGREELEAAQHVGVGWDRPLSSTDPSP